VRVLERNAVQDAVARALTSDEVAEAIISALDTEVADKVWADLLASGKAQMLVERIAEAPEVRAAIAQQGVGLVTDLGRRLTMVTEAFDDALENVAHRLFRRPGHEAETNQVGLVTRAVAAGIDLALLSGLFSIASSMVAAVLPVAAGKLSELPLLAVIALGTLALAAGASIIVTFWALVGQTPGMRLLSIRLDVVGSREVGLRRAIRRLFALPLALAPLGIGVLVILLSPTRRGWHDHLAGTAVIYDDRRTVAPHSAPAPDDRAARSAARGAESPSRTTVH